MAAGTKCAFSTLSFHGHSIIHGLKTSHCSCLFEIIDRYTTEHALKSYEKHGECITTDITIDHVKEGTMSLLNTQTMNSKPFFRVKGKIYPTETPAKFDVVFEPSSWVDHMIVALGPLDANGKYTYSIGTNHNAKRDLFVLVRDLQNWDKAAILAIIQTYELPAPVEVYQGKTCRYAAFINSTRNE